MTTPVWLNDPRILLRKDKKYYLLIKMIENI